jgi:invasion protein IalB
MPQREFEVTIGKTGEVELHVKGYKGKGCLAVAKIFEEIVGEMKSEQHTSEYYEPEEQVQYRIDQRH